MENDNNKNDNNKDDNNKKSGAKDAFTAFCDEMTKVGQQIDNAAKKAFNAIANSPITKKGVEIANKTGKAIFNTTKKVFVAGVNLADKAGKAIYEKSKKVFCDQKDASVSMNEKIDTTFNSLASPFRQIRKEGFLTNAVYNKEENVLIFRENQDVEVDDLFIDENSQTLIITEIKPDLIAYYITVGEKEELVNCIETKFRVQ